MQNTSNNIPYCSKNKTLKILKYIEMSIEHKNIISNSSLTPDQHKLTKMFTLGFCFLYLKKKKEKELLYVLILFLKC